MKTNKMREILQWRLLHYSVLRCTDFACIVLNLFSKTFVGGAILTDNKASGHNLQWTKAMISKPAPHWEGTAVHNGAMKELKLTDFKGKYLVCSTEI